MTRYCAHIGEDNAAWLIGQLAIPRYDVTAQTPGRGYIVLDQDATDVLSGLTEDDDGYVEVGDEGPAIWIAGEGYPLLPDEQLFNDDAAALAGMTVSAWRGAVARHDALIPDGRKIDKGHARPWWWTSTILAWQAGRPGRGARSDLAGR